MQETPQQPNYEGGRGFGLRDALTILIRRRWIIVGVALPIILFATLGTLRTSEVVSASTRVVIQAREPETPTFSNAYVDYDVLMSTAAQLVVSIPVAERAAAALIDTLPAVAAEHPGFPRFAGRHELRSALLHGVDCNQVGESNILSISFTHTNPRFALLAVHAITRAYIEYSIESKQDARAIGYYTDQIHLVQVEIDSLLSERAAILTAAGYSAFVADGQTGVSFLRSMEEELQDARSKRVALQAKLEGVLEAVAIDSDFVPALGAGENAIMVGLKNQLETAKVELAKLEVKYTRDSEWVQRQLKIVEAARAELARERENYIRDLRIKLREALGAEDSYAAIVSSQREKMATYPEVEYRVSSLDMMIKTQQDLLETLQMKRGEVRVKAGSDVRISDIVPLNEPAIDMRVGGSKKVLYLGVAIIFALVLGFVGAIFVERQDHRIFDRHGAEEALELPVLGAISRSLELPRKP